MKRSPQILLVFTLLHVQNITWNTEQYSNVNSKSHITASHVCRQD